MRRSSFAVAVAVVCLAVAVFGFGQNLAIVPTTTLALQSSNNTSAANSFITQSNGNLGASNVSKVDIHSLLYPGASTKIYAHMMLWFGQSNHMSVGYTSTSPAQVQLQIADMISRGIDGVIIDWYGPNNAIDTSAQAVMHEAELHPGFKFAIMVDQGAIAYDSCTGCTPQQALIQQLQYIEQTYFPSPAYLQINGAPAVANFNIDLSYTVDWTAAAAALATTPAFVFQDNNGFTHVLSDGSYSWVMPTTSDYGMSYLTSFYQTGMKSPQETTVGAAYKGFNDSLASWGSNRVMGQQCAATWLQAFSEINGLYNSSSQLPALQLVTWNDYEEGTEIESGIDNCAGIAATLSGSSLQWTLTGAEATVDHYVAYISTDGQNLMQLADIPTGQYSVDLCSYSLAAGNYQLYVQAVGKPTIINHLSSMISFSPQCGSSSSPAPAVTLATSPSTLTVSSGGTSQTSITAVSQPGTSSASISLSCSGLPQGLTCSFAPNSITPGASQASSVLTVSAAGNAISGRNDRRPPVYAAYWLGLGIAGFVGMGQLRRRAMSKLSLVLLAIGMAVLLCSCGAGKTAAPVNNVPPSTAGVTPGSYTITIDGTSATAQVSTQATVTVE